MTDTAALTGVLLFIFAAASGFSWTLTVAYLPQRLVALLHSVGNSTEIFMVGSIALLIVAGVLLEGLPSLNVLAPLLLPIASKLGLSGLHYALVLIIAMGVGGFMPLAGVGFYVCCAIMRCDVEAASRAMLPYLFVVLGRLADRRVCTVVRAVPAALFRLSWVDTDAAPRATSKEESHGSQSISEVRRWRCRIDARGTLSCARCRADDAALGALRARGPSRKYRRQAIRHHA